MIRQPHEETEAAIGLPFPGLFFNSHRGLIVLFYNLSEIRPVLNLEGSDISN